MAHAVSTSHLPSRTTEEDNASWLKTILGATLVFNLVDLLLTLGVVTTGLAVEANPIMASLLETGPVAFALAKVCMVSFGVLVLWRERTRLLAVAGSIVVFAVYSALMLYHLQSVQALLT